MHGHGNRGREASVKTRKPRIILLRKSSIGPGRGEPLELEIMQRYSDITLIGAGRRPLQPDWAVRVVSLPALRPPLLGGLLFYSVAPVVALLIAGGHGGSAILCRSVYEAFGVLLLARLWPWARHAKVIVEVHGDWRKAPRLYGHPSRRLLAPVADAIASWSIRRAELVRVVSDSARELVRGAGYTGEIVQFTHLSDYAAFLEAPTRPLPLDPNVAFVGALEPCKAVDVLIDAWVSVAERIPGAKLRMAGDGTKYQLIHRQIVGLGLEQSAELLGSLSPAAVSDLLDSSICLVLPSRSEGLGIVILEAMARARPVVASTTGGITEIVEDRKNGLLVHPDDRAGLAKAMIELLEDRECATLLGKEGRRRFLERDPASEFSAGIARVAEWVAGH